MGVYVENFSIPELCEDCPFINKFDNCILQDDEDNELAEDWDDLKRGCPLIEVPYEVIGRYFDELSSDMRDYCEKYEQTYNSEDGSM